MSFIETVCSLFIPKKTGDAGLFEIGGDSKLFETARIINNTGKRENISIGNHTYIRGELLTFSHGGAIRIGDYCYLGANSYIWSDSSIAIGNRVLISHNCNIFDNDIHPLDPDIRHEQYKSILGLVPPPKVSLHSEAVSIEDDVLIGANCTILKGVTIGRAAVVGAGSVVTKNIPSFTLVAGNPARILRKIPSK